MAIHQIASVPALLAATMAEKLDVPFGCAPTVCDGWVPDMLLPIVALTDKQAFGNVKLKGTDDTTCVAMSRAPHCKIKPLGNI